MAAIIEFRLPTEEFALEETLDTYPEAHIEIERVVADDPDKITPYIWARADDFEAFEAAFEDDPTVESMTLLSETEDERSYQMTWTGSIGFTCSYRCGDRCIGTSSSWAGCRGRTQAL